MDTIKDSVAQGCTTAKRALSTAPPNDAYLQWNASGVENIKPDEEVKAQEIAETMNKMQKHNFDKHRHAFRATHVKTQGLVKGNLTVSADLPSHLRQGAFAKSGTYPVVARYANEPVFLQDDKDPGPRGIALKVFNVDGKRLQRGDNVDDHTQDFFFNNAPMIELTDIDTCLEIMRLREKHFDDPTGLSLALKTRTDVLKQHAPAMLPNTNVISHSMYTQGAFRFGQYYGHMALFPTVSTMRKNAEKVSTNSPHAQLSDWPFDYFKGEAARYEFKIQLGTSPDHHPTEDASVVWDEATAPYQTIGSLEFPRQDSFSQERRVFWEDHPALDPWRGLEAHRPLGSINRLRKIVYKRSQKRRDELNANTSVRVQSIDEIP